MPTLLAVDLGVHTGLALYGGDGRLRWYRSQNFGTRTRLRRAIPEVLHGAGEELAVLVLEGPKPLATVWQRCAERRGLAVWLISAEQWRAVLLYERQRRTGEQAKRSADVLAREVIAWAGAPRPTSLRHDAAEAILIGLWGVLQLGWLGRVPKLP